MAGANDISVRLTSRLPLPALSDSSSSCFTTGGIYQASHTTPPSPPSHLIPPITDEPGGGGEEKATEQPSPPLRNTHTHTHAHYTDMHIPSLSYTLFCHTLSHTHILIHTCPDFITVSPAPTEGNLFLFHCHCFSV